MMTHVEEALKKAVLPKITSGVRVGVVRTQFYPGLNPAEHDRVGRFHHVPPQEDIVASFLVQKFQYPGVPEKTKLFEIQTFLKDSQISHLIFSSSRLEKNTFLRSMVIGSSDSFSSSFPWLCLSSSLDHATRTAYGRWCGFS